MKRLLLIAAHCIFIVGGCASQSKYDANDDVNACMELCVANNSECGEDSVYSGPPMALDPFSGTVYCFLLLSSCKSSCDLDTENEEFD